MHILQKLAVPAFLIVFAACSNSSDSKEANDVIDTTIQPAPAAAASNNNGQVNPAPLPVTSPQAPVAGTAIALNPEHGKPGHRCDIAVGAPLDGKPAAAPAATTAPATPQNVVLNNPAPATTAAAPVAAGMNPAHGQPGHRCDIAVGAPLNSKPSAAPSTTSTPLSLQPSVPEAKTITTPAAPATQPVAATAPGMNPPHGQPGHRCDIAVGSPLNSKPISVTKGEEKPKDN